MKTIFLSIFVVLSTSTLAFTGGEYTRFQYNNNGENNVPTLFITFSSAISAYQLLSCGLKISGEDQYDVCAKIPRAVYGITGIVGLAISPETSLLSGVSGLYMYTLDGKLGKEEAKIILDQSQDYFATGAMSIFVESLIKTAKELGATNLSDGEILEKINEVSAVILKNE